VNNYERNRSLPEKSGVQFAIKLANNHELVFPEKPVAVPASARFIWPVNLDLGHGVTLAWATAQPLCVHEEGGSRTIYFAETPGVPAEFSIGSKSPQSLRPGDELKLSDKIRVILLGEKDSLAIAQDAKGSIQQDPPPAVGLPLVVKAELTHAAGPLRTITLGKISQPVAVEPTDEDFKQAAVWRLTLPEKLDLKSDAGLLKIHYQGDVARLAINGRLITDDFYNGRPLEIDLRRHAAELKEGEITFAVLPLRKDVVIGPSPLIYIPNAAKPDFAGQDSVARLERVEWVPVGEMVNASK